MIEWLLFSIVVIVLAYYFLVHHKGEYEEDTIKDRTIQNVNAFKGATQRGTNSERNLVHLLSNYDIPPETIFHDLYVKIYGNSYSQIDLVVATKVGLIVFEVKDYSGWIFGTGYQRNWTQVLNYGQDKYRFYNPIFQNNTHINQLKKKLPLENIPYFSVIVFYGNCELRDISYIPKNTYIAKPHTAYKAFKTILDENPPANFTDKRNIVKVLKEAVANGENPLTQQQHAQNLRDRIGKHRILR